MSDIIPGCRERTNFISFPCLFFGQEGLSLSRPNQHDCSQILRGFAPRGANMGAGNGLGQKIMVSILPDETLNYERYINPLS